LNDGLSHGVPNSTSKDVALAKPTHRRRSWYRRRLRLRRISVAVFVALVIFATCWQHAARYFSLPTLHASQVLPDSFWARGDVHKNLAVMAARSSKSPKHARAQNIYPYSVVPGGITNLNDLRAVSARDYVVRRHYSHFDFSRAHLIRATKAREVYLSYRIRNTIFWTRKKIRLHLGELLLTDGNITARARCGNQISDSAKPEVSDEEPADDVLDQPVASLEPGPSLTIHPVLAPPDLPGGQPSPPVLFGSTFSFPYVPVNVPIPARVCPADEVNIDGHCRHKHRKKPVVPEPSTFLLLASGLPFVFWRYKRILPRPASSVS
jgi:hypothetical protein